MEITMDKQRARQLYELADRLSKLDVKTLSEEQRQQRNTMISKLQKEVKTIKEFAPDDGSGGEEDTLHKYARMWYNGNDAVQQQVEKILARQGWEIGKIESEEGGAFVVQAGDENGNSYIGFEVADLTEVLDTKASTATSQWDTSDPDMIKFNFTASNGVRYQLDFLEPYIGPDKMSPYDFFDSDEVYNKSKFVSFEQITQDMKGGHPVAKQGIEGTGSAAEVFGIVTNAIIQYVKKARPALLYFQAAEPNRRALYARIIRRILPDLPGWDSTADDAGQFAIYNRRAIKSAMGAEVTEGITDTANDPGEYDQEGDMARQDLATAANAAEELRSILDSDENLPEWVQSKITKAVDYLDTVRDYMKSKDQDVAENTAAGINKMFNNLGDPVFANLQRVALLAMQGRQSEAAGRLQTVIKDADPAVQKKITDAVNSIKPVTINGRVADSSTLDKSKQHNDWIINTFIPWVQSLLGQQGVAEAKKPSPKLTPVNIKKSDQVSEEINTEAYERLQKVFAFKNYES